MSKKKVRLIEREVQEVAEAHLEQYYKIKHNVKHFYSNLEERTKRKFGMKRADGMMAYKLSAKKAYVISMEAKSHKTLPALKPYRVDKLWRRDSMWKGFLFCMLTGVLFIAWSWRDAGYLRVLLPFGVWAVATLIHAFLFRNSYKYQEMQVIHQVFQYPGNEQWLSFSEDAFDMIDKKLQGNLFKICEARGVGVLMVDANQRVNIIVKPKKHNRLFGDFLIYYHYENEIRRFLGINPRQEGGDQVWDKQLPEWIEQTGQKSKAKEHEKFYNGGKSRSSSKSSKKNVEAEDKIMPQVEPEKPAPKSAARKRSTTKKTTEKTQTEAKKPAPRKRSTTKKASSEKTQTEPKKTTTRKRTTTKKATEKKTTSEAKKTTPRKRSTSKKATTAKKTTSPKRKPPQKK